MISPPIEEVLEGLYIHEVEGAEYPRDALTPAALKDALSAGLVRLEGGECRLTSDGRAAGRDVVRRHRLAERLLRDVLAAGGEHMEEAACRFEHMLLNGLDDKICTLLGHPANCPHGKPIPEGDCCRKARADHIAEVTPLCDGKPGAKGIVAYLSTRDNREVQKMMAMGVLPGTEIELIRRFPSYVFQLGYSQFTIDKQLAEIIYIHWKGASFPAGGAGSGERP